MYVLISPSSVQFTLHATKAKINALRLHCPEEYILVHFGDTFLLEIMETVLTQLAFHAVTAISS